MPGERPRVWTIFLAYVVAVGAMVFASAVAMMIWLPDGQVSGGNLTLEGLLVTGLAAEGVLLLSVLAFARPLSRRRLRLEAQSLAPFTIYAAAIGTIALGQAVDSASTLLGFYEYGSLAELRRLLSAAHGLTFLLALLVVGVLAGCAEEIFFRGFVQTRLVERWGTRAGVLVTSVLFGLMHMDPLHAVLAFFIGLWLGHVTLRTGSIRPAMAAHVFNNVVATFQAAYGLTTPAVGINLVVGLLSLMLFLFCAWRLQSLTYAAAHSGVFQPPTSATSLSASAGPQVPGS